MNVTQKGTLTEEEREELTAALGDWRRAEGIQADVRAKCVEAVGRSSYREVAAVTGFSTNTLQRWKREMDR